MHAAVRIHLLDFDDVRVLERAADFAFAAEQIDDRAVAAAALGVDRRRIAVPAAQHFHGMHVARLAMDGAKHAGERARAHAIQHLVVAVEEAGSRVAAHQPLELILRQQAASQESLLKRRQRYGRGAELAPDALKLRVIDNIDVQRPLGQLFRCFNVGHGTQLRDECRVPPPRQDSQHGTRDRTRFQVGHTPRLPTAAGTHL